MQPILISNANIQIHFGEIARRSTKPLSLNRYTGTDIFEFANELHELKIANGEIVASYDVSSLFTNVPLDDIFLDDRDTRGQSFHQQLV